MIALDDLIDLARFILENNFFEFEDKIYRQKLGTAIGTKFAPSFANLFMFDLERKLLREYRLSPWVWWRFLDDIFIIWLHDEEKLKDFFSYANSFHETMKFTWDWSTEKLPFLDVMVRRRGNGLVTDVYPKPTDAHQYLDHRSCHRNHVKNGIPYGQALRLRRICDSDEVFEKD